jgi:carbon-monoxide dehydrogenase medium subunit
MYDFHYHRPASLDEALRILATDSDSKPVAGGMSLVPMLKLRLAQVSSLVDLADIEELRGIYREAGALVIRAMTSHAAVAASDEVNHVIEALSMLAGGIGDPLVRNRGTIGGSIAHADPAADYPAGALALGATIITDRRAIPAEEFFTKFFETALNPLEIIKEVRFPIPERAGYAKFPNPASRFAVAGVFVAKFDRTVRVAVTGAGPTVFRLAQAEDVLCRRYDPSALTDIQLSPADLNSDIHASAEYRAHVVVEMTRRAVEASLS